MIVKIESNVKFKLNTISVRIDGLIMDWPRIINKTATVNSSGSYECSANFNTFNSSNNQPSIIYLTGNYRIQHVYLNITRDTYISNVEWVKPTPCAPIYVSCEQLTELQYLNGVYRTFDEN